MAEFQWIDSALSRVVYPECLSVANVISRGCGSCARMQVLTSAEFAALKGAGQLCRTQQGGWTVDALTGAAGTGAESRPAKRPRAEEGGNAPAVAGEDAGVQEPRGLLGRRCAIM